MPQNYKLSGSSIQLDHKHSGTELGLELNGGQKKKICLKTFRNWYVKTKSCIISIGSQIIRIFSYK